MNQKGKQSMNFTGGNNQKPQEKAKDQPETEAIQASNTETKKNWAGRAQYFDPA